MRLLTVGIVLVIALVMLIRSLDGAPPSPVTTRVPAQPDARGAATPAPIEDAASSEPIRRADVPEAHWLTRGVAPDAFDEDEGEAVTDQAMLPTIAGRIAWLGSGTPLVGAHVTLTPNMLDTVIPTSKRAASFEMLEDLATTTDGFGVFAIAPVPDARELFLRITHGEHLVEVRKVARLPSGPERIELGNVFLDRRGSINGRVVARGDERPIRIRAIDDHFFREKPLREELTAARLADAERFRPGVSIDTTDVAGRLAARDDALPFAETTTYTGRAFTLRGVRPGSTRLVVQSISGEPIADHRDVIVVAERTTDIGDWHVEPSDFTTVHVRFDGQAPVEGADVRVSAPGEALTSVAVRTDDRGIARVPFAWDEEPKRVLVHVRRARRMPWEFAHADRASDGSFSVRLPPTKPVEIRVKTLEGTSFAGDGIVVASFRDGDHRVFPETEPGVWRRVGFVGRTTVIASAPGFAPGVAKVTPGLPATIELVPAFPATVQVVDARGDPIPEVRVHMRPHRVDHYEHSGSRWDLIDEAHYVGRTDDLGLVRVDGVWDTWFTVTAHRGDVGRARTIALPNASAPEVRLVLLSFGGVRGYVTRDGHRASSSRWVVRVEPKREPGRSSVPPTRTVLATNDGYFEINGLEPGEYALVVREPDIPRPKRAEFWWRESSHGEVARESIVIEPGATKHVDVAIQRGTKRTFTIRGTALVNDAPRQGLEVRAFATTERGTVQTTRSTVVDEEGRFELDARSIVWLHDAVVELRLRHGTKTDILATKSFERTYAAFREPIEFRVEVGGIASALFDGGTPLKGRMVRFVPTDATRTIRPVVVSDAIGYVHADAILTGQYRLVVDRDGRDPIEFGPIEITRDGLVQRDLFAN